MVGPPRFFCSGKGDGDPLAKIAFMPANWERSSALGPAQFTVDQARVIWPFWKSMVRIWFRKKSSPSSPSIGAC